MSSVYLKMCTAHPMLLVKEEAAKKCKTEKDKRRVLICSFMTSWASTNVQARHLGWVVSRIFKTRLSVPGQQEAPEH